MSKDLEICKEIVNFIKENGPVVKCTIIAQKARLTLEVLPNGETRKGLK